MVARIYGWGRHKTLWAICAIVLCPWMLFVVGPIIDLARLGITFEALPDTRQGFCVFTLCFFRRIQVAYVRKLPALAKRFTNHI